LISDETVRIVFINNLRAMKILINKRLMSLMVYLY